MYRLTSIVKRFVNRNLSGVLILSVISLVSPQSSFADSAGTGACEQTFTKSDSGTVTVTELNGYCYVAFKNTGAVGSQATFTWSRPANVSVANILVVAGGGGGGSRHAGGGGAGGYIETSTYSISATSILVAVGGGGAGAAGGSGSVTGTNGQDSYFKTNSGGLTALGGGGGTNGATPAAGGSTGGTGSPTLASTDVTASTTTTLTGTLLTGMSFGNKGNYGASDPDAYDYWAGGGGGGAGSAGSKPTPINVSNVFTSRATATGGAGGSGKAPTWISTSIATSLGIGEISSSSVYFSGGGGGGMGVDGFAGGPGGLGGGATGTVYTPTAQNTLGTANAGAAFTGGGGGGSGFDDVSPAGERNPVAGAGGSGVVVLRYAATYTLTYSYNSATGSNSTETATATTGGSAITLPTPTRTNYTFSGWYEASDFSGLALTSPYAPSQSRTIYAKWTAVIPYYLTFSGSGSSYASVTSRSIIPATETFTAEAWISPTEYGGSPVILSQGATGARFYFKLNSTGRLVAYQEGGGAEVTSTNAAIPLNTWTHVAFVKSGNSASLYVNGTLQTTNTSDLGTTAIGSGFYVGAYSANDSATGTLFKGLIDEVKIWNSARTASELSANKEVAPLISDSTLLAYFPFDATTGTTAVDLKDSANNLTLRTSMTWSPLARTVTYAPGTYGSGSTDSQTATSSHTSSVTLKLAAEASGITRTGYAISAWNTNAGGTGGTSYALGATYSGPGDLTLYPTWSASSLSINYSAGTSGAGSAPTSPVTINSGETFTAPTNTYSRANYRFAGWSDGTNVYAAGSRYPASGTVSTSVTLTATWELNSLTVTYNSQGGSSVSSGSVNEGSSISSAPTAPTKSGYTFSGWSDTTTGTLITFPYTHGRSSNFTLYAIWSADALTLTYDSLGGSSVPTVNTVSGGSISIAPTPPTKSNYTFAGWSATNGGSAITFPYTHGSTSNFTLYARWTANVYTLTYFYNSATGGNSTETATATTGGSSITLPTPTRTGYTFDAWYAESTFTNLIGAAGATYMPTGSSLSPSAYAKWAAISYSVTYATTNSTSGSSPTDSTNYNIGNSVIIKGNTGPLARTGYSLAGWTAASDGSGTVLTSGSTFTVASANMTFYPKWSANTYTVTYNKNGASGSPTAATASYTTASTAITLTTVGTMVKTGFDFGGWSTTPTGSALAGTYTTSGDVTLYAVWTIKSISISFAKGDASSSTFINWPTSRSANYGATITLNDTVDSAVDISSVSHAFMGWNDGTSIYQSGATYLIGESAPTFTAIWVKVFAVRYAFNGGTAAAGSSAVDAECLQAGTTCTDGQVITANAAPSRTGYTFAGWVDQNNVAVTAGGTFTVRSNRYLIYANWTPVNYAITYETNGGSAAPTETSKQIGQSFTLAATPTKTGYNFTGWSDGTSTYGAGTTYYVGSSAVTLTAQWSPKFYTLIYDWNGGSGSTTNNDTFTVGTSAITLPLVGNHVKDGYTFSGWSETSDGSLLSGGYTPTADKTLYAIWGSGSYTLTYDANGGTVATSSAAVQNGSSLTLPTPTRSNFVFEGWFTASTGGTRIGSAGATYQPTQSKTFYAQWTQSSLYGLNSASLSRIGTTTASTGSNSTFTSSNANSSVSVTVPAGSLPNGTNVYFDLVGDFSRAQSVLTGTNSYIISLVVSWLTSSGTVPDTAADKPISVTLSNSSIRSGMKVYGIVAGTVTLLGTATQDGTVTVSVYSDPEVVVVATKPGPPTSVSATSNGTQQSIVSWSAPTSDGGSAITGYTVTANSGGTCTTSTTSCTVTGLTDGTSYTFTVTATNALGTSDSSSSATGRTANAAGSGASSSSSGSNSAPDNSSSRSNVTVTPSVVVVGDRDVKIVSVEVTTAGSTAAGKPATLVVDSKSKAFISEVKIVDGKLTLTPEQGFSGKRSVTVTITENGSERIIQIPLTVLPEPVSNPVATPSSAGKSVIRWVASPNATEYTVFVDGKRVCVRANTNCSISELVGPSSLIEIISKGGDRTYSQRVKADFKLTTPVLIGRLINSSVPKATLSQVDRVRLDKVASLIEEKGFTQVIISTVKTSKSNQRVADARIAAIKKYLVEKSGSDSIIFETVAASSGTYFNNISVKG